MCILNLANSNMWFPLQLQGPAVCKVHLYNNMLVYFVF